MSAAAAPLNWNNTLTATQHRTSTELLRLPISLSRLLDLLAETGEDDYGAIGPTLFAFSRAFRVVLDAISILGEDFASSPTVDSQGGIRITWRRGDRQIKLMCPANRDVAVYIYQSSPAGNSVRDQGVTAQVLAEKLSWLIHRQPARTE